VWLTVSLVAQLVVVAALCFLVLSLARQVGILHRRLAPAGGGARGAIIGPGEPVDLGAVRTLVGGPLIRSRGEPARRLLLFVSPECPICRSLLPVVQRSGTDDFAGRVWWSFADVAAGRVLAYVEEHGLDPEAAIHVPELASRLDVRELPMLVVLDAASRLERRTVVSGPRQLESLLAELDLAGDDTA